MKGDSYREHLKHPFMTPCFSLFGASSFPYSYPPSFFIFSTCKIRRRNDHMKEYTNPISLA